MVNNEIKKVWYYIETDSLRTLFVSTKHFTYLRNALITYGRR